jgi:hypothetical protein
VGCFSRIGVDKNQSESALFDRTIQDAVAACNASLIR